MAETDIPVIMRFLAETEDVQRGADEVEDATEESIDSLQALAESASQIAQEAVDRVAGSYRSLRAEVQSIAAAAAVAGTATAVGIVSLGRSAVNAAADFEGLRNRLKGLTGDAETAGTVFADAVKLAANTKFSVGGIVQATSALESFGVGGTENLQLVADIATATGGRIEDVSLRVAKALAGSSEGFQALRDTAGITGAKLAKFGANLSTASLVSVNSAKDIKLATDALKELGRTQFGGAAAEGAAGFEGAISNAKDAVTRFLAVIGEAALPTISSLARGFASGVNAATEFIQPFAPLIAFMGAFSAAAAGAVGAVAGFAIPFAGVIAKVILVRKALTLASVGFIKFGGSSAALALVQTRVIALASTIGGASAQVSIFNAVGSAFSSTVVPKMVAGFAAVRAGAAAVLASPLTPFLIGIAAAAGLAALAINSYENEQKKLGKSIEDSARKLQGASTGFKDYVNILEDATGQEFSRGLDIGKTVDETRVAISKLSAVDLAAALQKSGKSADQLSTDLAENRKQAAGALSKLVSYQEALNSTSGSFVDVFRQSDAVRKVLKETFGDRVQVSVSELESAMASTNLEFTKLGQQKTIIQALVSAIGEIPKSLELASTQAEQLGAFLSFANRLDGITDLNKALGFTNDRLREVESNLLKAVGTLDRFELTKKLADGANTSKEQAETIKAYLGLLDSRASLESKVASEVESAKKAEIAAFELVTERRKVLGDLTLTQERSRIKSQISSVEEGTSEEVALLKRLAAVDEQIRKERVDKTNKLLDEQLSAVRNGLSEVQSSPDSTNAEVAGKLRESISALEGFERANKKAFAGAPEAAQRFQQSLVGLKRELRSAEAGQLVDQLNALKSSISSGIDQNGTTGQQLAQTAAAIDLLKKAIASGTVDQAQGEQYLIDLERQKLDLNREQTDEKLRQANEVSALQQRALEEEIRVLELRKAAGENVDSALADSRTRLLAVRLDAIEKEREASIKAGADVTLADKKAALEKESLLRKETVRQFQEAGKSPSSSQFSRQAQNVAGNGSNSPSFNPFSSQNTSNFAQTGSGPGIGAARLPDFASGFGVSRFKRPEAPKAPSFEAIQRRVAEEQKRVEGTVSSQDVTNINHDTTINLKVDDTGDAVTRKLKEAGRDYAEKERKKSLTASSDSDSPLAAGLSS